MVTIAPIACPGEASRVSDGRRPPVAPTPTVGRNDRGDIRGPMPFAWRVRGRQRGQRLIPFPISPLHDVFPFQRAMLPDTQRSPTTCGRIYSASDQGRTFTALFRKTIFSCEIHHRFRRMTFVDDRRRRTRLAGSWLEASASPQRSRSSCSPASSASIEPASMPSRNRIARSASRSRDATARWTLVAFVGATPAT